MSARPCLEVCVDTVAGLDVAIDAGADRVELCSALNLAGLTPSSGMLAAAGLKRIPCFVLIRPRAGNFCYDQRDVDVMRREIDEVRAMGLAGVVIGANRSDGSLDEETLRELVAHADGLPAVLHRAFDLVPDFHAALEKAISLGFKRVLTSGGAPIAPLGTKLVRELVEQAGDRIEVMAGAGLSPQNIAQFVHETGVRAVHSSCSAPATVMEGPTDSRANALGFIPANHRVTDPGVVAAMIAALDGLRGD